MKKKYKKGFFFNNHKYKNQLDYKKKFLNKVKIFLSHFINFNNDRSILS